MGQALDRDGNVLGEVEGETKREVFDKLTAEFKDAAELRIKSLGAAVADERVTPTPVPSLGRIVLYRLSVDDALQINRRRTTGASIAERIHEDRWPIGAQAHIGNDVRVGDTFPMMITRLWGSDPKSAVNGQVFLDGNDCLWATSVQVGEGPRTFSWPGRV